MKLAETGLTAAPPAPTVSRRRTVLVIVLAVAAAVAIAAGVIARYRNFRPDFVMRYNEILCVRAGVNPFDIWNGTASLPGFCRFDAKPVTGAPVHTYPPWEYTLAMPLTFLSPSAAGHVVENLLVTFALLVAAWCFRRGRATTGSWQGGLFCAALALLTGLPLHEEFRSQNYYLLCTVATIGLAASLNRRRQVPAGLCWALMMIKPQYGLLFAIPILWRRQFLTAAVAAATCLALAVPPAVMTHTSLPAIILQAGRAGSEYFVRTALLPAALFQPLAARLGHAVPALASAALGIGVCLWMTWCVRRRADWFEFLLPTVFCTTLWTYCLMYGHVPYALLLCFAAERLWRARPGRERRLRALAVASMVNGLLLYFPLRLHSGDWIAAHLAPDATPATFARLSRLADIPFFGIGYLANYITFAWVLVFTSAIRLNSCGASDNVSDGALGAAPKER